MRGLFSLIYPVNHSMTAKICHVWKETTWRVESTGYNTITQLWSSYQSWNDMPTNDKNAIRRFLFHITKRPAKGSSFLKTRLHIKQQMQTSTDCLRSTQPPAHSLTQGNQSHSTQVREQNVANKTGMKHFLSLAKSTIKQIALLVRIKIRISWLLFQKLVLTRSSLNRQNKSLD